MTHRGPFQPLLFCDSVIFRIISPSETLSYKQDSLRTAEILLTSRLALDFYYMPLLQ